MRRNSLQGFANTLAEMAVASAPLYDVAADFPDGTIHVDLLTRLAVFQDRSVRSHPVVDRLADWLANRVDHSRVTTRPALLQAEIEIDLTTGPLATIRESIVQYLVKIRVTLRTAHETTTARQAATLWIRRAGAADSRIATFAN